MSAEQLASLITFFAVGIVVVVVISKLSGSRFSKSTHKDKFRKKEQIGKQNLGQTKQGKEYRQLAKERNLEEAKKLDTKVNPKVTSSIAIATRDVRENED